MSWRGNELTSRATYFNRPPVGEQRVVGVAAHHDARWLARHQLELEPRPRRRRPAVSVAQRRLGA